MRTAASVAMHVNYLAGPGVAGISVNVHGIGTCDSSVYPRQMVGNPSVLGLPGDGAT